MASRVAACQSPKITSHYTLRHCLAELATGLQRMIEMEPRAHSGPEDLVHQIARILKHVLVDAVAECEAVAQCELSWFRRSPQ